MKKLTGGVCDYANVFKKRDVERKGGGSLHAIFSAFQFSVRHFIDNTSRVTV